MIRTLFLNILLCCFLLLPLSGQAPVLYDLDFTGSLYHQDGKIYSGPIELIDKKGILREEGYISEGRIDSIQIYDKKGNLVRIEWYEENRLERHREFVKNLSTRLEINYRGTELHGAWTEFYPGGEIKEIHYYDAGFAIGTWKVWDKQGRIVREIDFDSDPIVGRYHTYKGDQHVMRLRVFGDEFGRQSSPAWLQKGPSDL